MILTIGRNFTAFVESFIVNINSKGRVYQKRYSVIWGHGGFKTIPELQTLLGIPKDKIFNVVGKILNSIQGL